MIVLRTILDPMRPVLDRLNQPLLKGATMTTNTWKQHLEHAIERMLAFKNSTIVDDIRIVNSASRSADAFSAIVDADGIRFVILITEKRFIVRPDSPSPFKCVFNRHSMPSGRRYLTHQAIESIIDIMAVMA